MLDLPQESGKKGKTSTETKSKPWFDVMMPADFGNALEGKLALQESLVKKVK